MDTNARNAPHTSSVQLRYCSIALCMWMSIHDMFTPLEIQSSTAGKAFTIDRHVRFVGSIKHW